MEKKRLKCPACGHIQEHFLAQGQTAYRCKHQECHKLVRAIEHLEEVPEVKEEPKVEEAPKVEEKKSKKKKKNE